MYQHHMESVERMKDYFAGTEGMIALVLGGSVAKGNERPDSDLDALVILTPEAYEKKAEREKRQNVCLAIAHTRAVILT